MDFYLRKFTKANKIIIVFCILFFYLIMHGLFSFFGGYLSDYFKDYGNLINYSFLVPGMFIFLHYSYIFLLKTIDLPISENIIIHKARYNRESQTILNNKWYLTLVFFLISIGVQWFNHYGIQTDGQDKTIWLEGLTKSKIWIFHYYFYYTILNAFLMFCLIDATYRWLRICILLWKLYYRKTYGEILVDNRYLIPNDHNPSFTIGKFLFYMSCVAIFVSINFATTTKINFGVAPDSEFIKTAITSLYWILGLPVIIFFLPAYPIKIVHKQYLDKIRLAEYRNLILSSANYEFNKDLFKYLDNIGKLKSLTIWPIKISIIQTIYTIYFIPIVIEIIKNLILL